MTSNMNGNCGAVNKYAPPYSLDVLGGGYAKYAKL
jgi:hypothetical protein